MRDAGTASSAPVPSSSRPTLAVVLLGAYVLTATIGLAAASFEPAVTLIWLPSGLAIGGVVRLGRPGWAAVLLGAFLVNLRSTHDVPFAALAAMGNALEAAVAAALFRRWVPEGTLGSSHAAARFCVAVALGCLCAATVGASALRGLLGVTSPVFAVAAHWYLGDVAGALLVAPLVIGAPVRAVLHRPSRGSLAVCALTTALVATVLCLPLPRGAETFVALSIGVPVLLCAFRAGLVAAHASALTVSLGAYVGAVLGRGPFGALQQGDAVLAVCACILASGSMALFASVLVGERNLAVRDLETLDERLHAVFENAPDGMLLLDERRNVLLANPVARGMAHDELTGDVWHKLSGDDGRPLREALARGIARGDRIVESSFRDGAEEHQRDYGVRVTLLGGKGAFRGAVVIVTDITERERVRRDHAEIDQHLAAGQRLESIGNLAGGIAHDFNNMLQAIQANLELAQISLSRGRDARDAIGRALDAGDRARTLTRQLLAFSRRQPARYDHVDVLAVVRSSLVMLERLLPADIHLVFTPHLLSAFIQGDATQIEQVLLNLIVNARDAMPEGGTLRIDVEAERLPAPADAGVVRIVVADQGPGVDPDVRDRIFEPFFTTKPTGKGTGLGLAVVYGIVKGHGGAIHVEPATPHGARFVVELPWLVGVELEPEIAVPEEVGTADGQTVLLVEDDRFVREATRDTLRDAGFHVFTAATGKDAVDHYRDARGTVDVVLLDVVMPGMGGREAFERLRELDPSVAVVFATGYSDEQLDVGFVRRERVPVLTKPYSRAALVRALLEAIAVRAAAGVEPS